MPAHLSSTEAKTDQEWAGRPTVLLRWFRVWGYFEEGPQAALQIMDVSRELVSWLSGQLQPAARS
jgi:hypothetical protein